MEINIKQTNMANLKYEDKLQKLFSNINDWLKFAEAKNLGLLTFVAAIAFGFTQVNFSNENIIHIAGCYIFLPVSLLSFLSSLISLFPILSKIESGDLVKSWISGFSNFIDKEKHFENIHYYGYLRNIQESEFEAKFLNKLNETESFTQYEKELATQILYNSRIAWLKYQLFKIGAFFFLCAIVISVVAMPLIKFFS